MLSQSLDHGRPNLTRTFEAPFLGRQIPPTSLSRDRARGFIAIVSEASRRCFAAVHESAIGPKRQFAAVQQYGRCRWNTGRSVDVAETAAPDPKAEVHPLLARP
jgi:hypothetical protein